MSMCKTLAATILAGTMLFAGSAAAADKAPLWHGFFQGW